MHPQFGTIICSVTSRILLLCLTQQPGLEYVSMHFPKTNSAVFHLFVNTLGYTIYAERDGAYYLRKQLKGNQMHSGETKVNGGSSCSGETKNKRC
ncbi:N-alpha-acetyltransferase 10-like [Trifolium medium]|uniref:N-alpha-acetyltransferase 10-like n=1 Tax=Trifolium medium TaxID=97028 RepID=A0A392MUA5_9FABA|nr:N-alpha-acetyltransferase 10-like [Trifolium medium]